jgi:hypothetical protein
MTAKQLHSALTLLGDPGIAAHSRRFSKPGKENMAKATVFWASGQRCCDRKSYLLGLI